MAPTRIVVLIGAALVGLVTFAVSAFTLYNLGARAIPEPLSAGLPIALDVVGAVGAVAWITDRDLKVKAWGRGMALGALIGTLGGNGLEAAIAAGRIEVTLEMIVAIGAIIPLALWSVVHLIALMTSAKPSRQSKKSALDGRKETRESDLPSAPQPAPRASSSSLRGAPGVPGTEIAESSVTESDQPRRGSSREEIAAFMRAWRAAHAPEPGEAQLAYAQRENDAVRARYDVSRPTLTRARRLSREAS